MLNEYGVRSNRGVYNAPRTPEHEAALAQQAEERRLHEASCRWAEAQTAYSLQCGEWAVSVRPAVHGAQHTPCWEAFAAYGNAAPEAPYGEYVGNFPGETAPTEGQIAAAIEQWQAACE